MKLTVVGLGYIGLPTSIMFAKHGVDVLGVDINQQTIDKLQSGQISIEEPDYKRFMKRYCHREN